MKTATIIKQLSAYDQAQASLQHFKHEQLSLELTDYQELSEDGNMIVGGVALTAGRHMSKVSGAKQMGPLYTPEVLARDAETLIGKNIYFDFSTGGLKHNPSSENMVGQITSAHYDKKINGIVWKGVLTAKKIYNKIKDKTLKAVSLGIFSFSKMINSIPEVENFLVDELSIVQRGADKNATVGLQ